MGQGLLVLNVRFVLWSLWDKGKYAKSQSDWEWFVSEDLMNWTKQNVFEVAPTYLVEGSWEAFTTGCNIISCFHKRFTYFLDVDLDI